MDKGNLKVYVGWDPRETLAHDVAVHSIRSRTQSAEVIPLKLSEIPELKRPVEWRGKQMWCPISDAPMGSEFSISRFAVPFLAKGGWAVFMDSDMVCLEDISEILEHADDRYAVMCVKHNHVPTDEEKAHVKSINRTQTAYQRKNWASVILWNCDHPSNKKLTWEMLNTLPGRDLHRFCWLEDDEIGALPQRWNHLIGVNSMTGDVAIAHFTLGGPWLPGWVPNEQDYYWNEAHKEFVKEAAKAEA